MTTKTKTAKTPKAKRTPKPETIKKPKIKKTDQLLEMLRRPEGVTIQQLQGAFNILPHSARAMISMAGKKLGRKIEGTRAAKGEPLVYRLPAAD